MRRKRSYRWIVVGIVAVLGLYFVLDEVTLQYLESRGAAQIARTLSAETATVDLGGLPFLPGFLTGHVSRAAVHIRGASAPGGLRVASIDVTIGRASFSPWRVLALARSPFSRRTRVNAYDPDATIELSQADLEDYLRRSVPAVGDVSIAPTGVAVRFAKPAEVSGGTNASPAPSPELTSPARYLPRVEERRIVLILVSEAEVPYSFRADAERIPHLVRLPPLPPGLSSDTRLGDGVIVIESTGPRVSVTIGGG